MGLNIFVIAIIFTSFFLIHLSVEEERVIKTNKNIPKVVFENSIMYELDETNVKRIVQSQQALNYSNRDELYDATIITRNNNNNSDTISAEYILKQKDIYRFYQNVFLNRAGSIQLQTEFLKFDEKTRIATNNTDFIVRYNESLLTGNNLYFDSLQSIIKGQNTHFMIKGEDLQK